MYVHIEKDDSVDPRVLRTRELLINSFARLLVERKSIRSVSVQSVTKLAGVNRVTFYAHFTDKYDLLDTWARLMFRQRVVEELPDDAELNRENLELLVSSTLEFFTARNKYKRRINEQFETMLEAAIQQELKSVIFTMLERTNSRDRSISNAHISLFLSWAIFGSLSEWGRTNSKMPKDKVISEIVSLSESVLD